MCDTTLAGFLLKRSRAPELFCIPASLPIFFGMDDLCLTLLLSASRKSRQHEAELPLHCTLQNLHLRWRISGALWDLGDPCPPRRRASLPPQLPLSAPQLCLTFPNAAACPSSSSAERSSLTLLALLEPSPQTQLGLCSGGESHPCYAHSR